MIAWLIAALVFILFLLIWLLPTRMEIRFRRQDGDDEGFIGVTALLGLVRYRKRLTHLDLTTVGAMPSLQIKHEPAAQGHSSLSIADAPAPTDDVPHSEHFSLSDLWHELPNVRSWLKFGHRATPILKSLLKRTQIDRFKCYMTIGTGDIISTGMVCGGVWAGIFTLLGRLSQFCRFPGPPDVRVEGNFSKPSMRVSFDCMVTIRTGYAIVAGLRLIRLWRRRGPHGTSDSGADANRNDKHS